jgi:carboxyl-terminal processing protease
LPAEQRKAAYEQMWKVLARPKPDRKMSPFAPSQEIQGRMLQRASDSFAYIVIPMCAAKYADWNKNGPSFQQFAEKLHRIVMKLDAEKPRGWIVDLRGNGGGNMWPMLAGIGAVLGEGQLGAFVSADGASTSWQYRNGKAGGAFYTEAATTETPFVLSDLPSVAVLFDRGTASSGEAVAISFAGRPHERSFGEHTAGFSTANSRFPLADGSALFLCVGTEADRTGRLYPDGLDPDVEVPEPDVRPTNDEDAAIQVALGWLARQNANTPKPSGK